MGDMIEKDGQLKRRNDAAGEEVILDFEPRRPSRSRMTIADIRRSKVLQRKLMAEPHSEGHKSLL
jgi:hypothetical protein